MIDRCFFRERLVPLVLLAVLAVSFLYVHLFVAADARFAATTAPSTTVLRVGSPEPVRQATVISPYGPGFEHELIARYCLENNCEPQWIPVRDRAEGFVLLQQGEVDVLAGFWGDEPRPGDHLGPALAAGKAYAHFFPVRVTGLDLPPEPDQARDEPGGLARLTGLFARIFSGRGAALERDEPPFPVFFQVDGGNRAQNALLLDPASVALWLPFIGDVDTAQVKTKTDYRWFWREDSDLAGSLRAFWSDTARDRELAELTERYFGFLPRTLRQRDILELTETLARQLPKYEQFIQAAARETGVPPLLLVAVIYQESRFNPDAVSATKVRGIMQLTSATARMLGVNRNDPEQCVMGGARYLRDLYDKTKGKTANDWDRWFMALAAYNQGMSNVNRTIILSRKMGGKGDTWADLKKAFPSSTTCRGLEARSFVEKIRYYHFMLHGLVALTPAESQDLAPLLSLASAGN